MRALEFVGCVPQLPMSLMPHEMVRNEFEVLGSRANSKRELEETVALASQGRIEPAVDRVFSLEDV